MVLYKVIFVIFIVGIQMSIDNCDTKFVGSLENRNDILKNCPSVNRVFYEAVIDWGKCVEGPIMARKYRVFHNDLRLSKIMGELDRYTNGLFYQYTQNTAKRLRKIVHYSMSRKRDIWVTNCWRPE